MSKNGLSSRAVVMVICFFWTCSVALADKSIVDTNVSVKVKTEHNHRYWIYTITWTGDLKEGRKVGISFNIAEDYTNATIEGAEESFRTKDLGGFRQWVFSISPQEAQIRKKIVTMTFSGPLVELKKDGFVKWRGEYDMSPSSMGIVAGPELEASRFRIVIGGGADISVNDHVDFKVQETPSREDPEIMESYLVTVNDSRIRAGGHLGGAFRINKAGRPWDAIVSLQFVSPTSRYLDGFFVGLSYSVQKYLSVGFGYSLRIGTELSHGFQRTAARFVTEEGLDDRFPVSMDGSRLKSQMDYDGLPLMRSNGVRWYPGDPIVESTSHSILIGLFVPIDFTATIKRAIGLHKGK